MIGASGYSGQELLLLLLSHPKVNVSYIASQTHQGKSLAEYSSRFIAHKNLVFEKFCPEKLSSCCDLVFLALPHGIAFEYAKPLLEKNLPIIDLSADFRF